MGDLFWFLIIGLGGLVQSFLFFLVGLDWIELGFHQQSDRPWGLLIGLWMLEGARPVQLWSWSMMDSFGGFDPS